MSNFVSNRFLKNWSQQVLTPKISASQLHEELEKARQNLPVPVFWILGKTQSGKSSLIQALTGSTQAEIGEGFRACTRCARVFDFPEPDTAFVRFLDTRGLGEASYDPDEDMAWCQQQSHLLMVVIKAMDHELDAIESAVRRICKSHPEWPLLIVQTCLHEAYVDKNMDHIRPYPFADDNIDNRLPPDLVRSMRMQREQFHDLPARFVAVDFTQQDDGYTPQYYGIEALWNAIETALPLGLRQLLIQSSTQSGVLNDIYAKHAHPHIVGYAISTGLLAATPLPLVTVPLVIAAQGKLFHSIASIYGLPLTRRSISEIASAIGIGSLGMSFGVRELAKLAPGWGSAVAGLSTAAMTYALGMTLCYYYGKTRQGESFSAEALKRVYQEQLQRGRELLQARFKQEK